MEVIIIIGLVIYLYTVDRRVRALEEREQKVPLPLIPVAPAVVATTFVPVTPLPAPSFTPIPLAPVAGMSEHTFVDWLKKDFLVKLGALLLLIAFGWFVSYAFSNNWIGPMGRIGLGLAAGVAFIVFGYIRVTTQPHQGALFAAFGSAVVLLTTFAARELYGFFNPAIALGIMFVSVLAVAYLAVREKRESLALAGLVLGLIAPFLTNSPEPSELMFFSYVTVVVLGSIWVAYRIKADMLLLVTYIMVALYSVPFILSGKDAHITIFFGFLFTIIFFVTNMKTILSRAENQIHPVDLITAVGTGLYIAGWIESGAITSFKVLIYIAWALVFTLGAFVVYRETRNRMPFSVYGGVALGLLAAATAHQFSGPALTIAYTVEVAVVVVLAALLLRDRKIVERLCLLFTGPILLSVDALMAPDWSTSILHAPFFSLLVLMLMLLTSGLIVRSTVESSKEEEQIASAGLLVTGTLYAMSLVWLMTHAVMVADFATMTSLLVYTVTGIALYVHGVTSFNKRMQIFGGMIIGGVVLRLLLIEVWQMELTGRILTFFAIGILLISTAFIKKLQTPK